MAGRVMAKERAPMQAKVAHQPGVEGKTLVTRVANRIGEAEVVRKAMGKEDSKANVSTVARKATERANAALLIERCRRRAWGKVE